MSVLSVTLVLYLTKCNSIAVVINSALLSVVVDNDVEWSVYVQREDRLDIVEVINSALLNVVVALTVHCWMLL